MDGTIAKVVMAGRARWKVYDEMIPVGKIAPGIVEVKTLDWINTQPVPDNNPQPVSDNNQVINLRNNQDGIDLGEAETIVLAQELNAGLLLMDERRGRAVAIAQNLMWLTYWEFYCKQSRRASALYLSLRWIG